MQRYAHNLGFAHQTTFDQGELIPLACIEVLPGDTFRHSTSIMIRVAPLVTPVMHPVQIRVAHFYVPNRLMWDDFDEWVVGDDTKIKPTITPPAGNRLFQYFGGEAVGGVAVDAAPFHAYNMIWNEYYRDIDLQVERVSSDGSIARINWEKDYFTACRPSPTNNETIEIPLKGSGTMPIKNIWQSTASAPAPQTPNWLGQAFAGDPKTLVKGASLAPVADFSAATGGIDINEFRRAMALQRFHEARARYGDRYVDYLRFLGVNPADGRLDRPEYLGGGNSWISFSEVLATAEGENTDVGDMSGHGIATCRTAPYRKYFEEHGWVLTLCSIRPRSMYTKGIPKRFVRTDPMQVWQKELEILPWQEVYQRELFGAGSASTIFGYTGRYDEYRHNFSYVSGTMLTTEASWHMAREFSSAPALNSGFVQCDPTDRIYADTSMPEIIASCSHDIAAMRLVRGEPNV